MDPQLSLSLCRCIRARALLYGGEAVILEKEADLIAGQVGPAPATIHDANPDQIRALSLAQQAHQARRRYFREREAIDLMEGHSSPFRELG